MLEKKQNIRKVEFIFTEGKVHPECHCLYEIKILEDGKEISKSNHRENKTCVEMQSFISGCQPYQHPQGT